MFLFLSGPTVFTYGNIQGAQEIINNAEIPVCSIIPTLKKDLTVFHPY